MTNMDVTSAASAGPQSPVAETQQSRTPTHLDRQQILDATALSLREFGYDKTTIRRIAKLLDCAVGSIYRYFKDKRELLFAVTQQTLEPVRDLLRDGATYRESIAAYHEIATNDPVSYRLMFWLSSLGQGDGYVPPIVHELFAEWSRHLGSEAAVHRDFASLHGLLAMGAGLDQVLAVLDADATLGHSSSSDLDALAGMSAAEDRSGRLRDTAPSYATQVKVRDDADALAETVKSLISVESQAQPVAQKRMDIEGIMPRTDIAAPTPTVPMSSQPEPSPTPAMNTASSDADDDVCLL